MLTLRFETDIQILKPIYLALGLDGEVNGTNFVFYDEDKQVGLWRMAFVSLDTFTLEVDVIRFLDEVEFSDKNFFVRAVLFKLNLGAPVQLVIKGEHLELEVLGFQLVNGDMHISTEKIILHSCCSKG